MKKVAVLLMVLTLLSKLLGFVREIIFSYFYGASNISDVYLISMTIPTVVFSFIGTGITTGFIPMYSKIEKKEGVYESNKFTNNLVSILTVICTIVVISVQIFAEPIVKIFASGFKGDTLVLAIMFTRITVLGIYFTGIMTIFTGFLQIKDKFVIPAILGFIYNVFIIISFYFSYKIDIIILSIGSVIASLIQFIFILYFVVKEKFILHFFIDLKNKHIRTLAAISLPLIFGTSISEINVLVDKTIASTIAVGGISALNYADRLKSFILSIVVMSISTVIYPMMSKIATDRKYDEFKKIISGSIIAISLLLVPSTVGMVIFAEPMVNLLFARGAFDSQAITLTSSALLFFSLGMLAIGLREILSRAFYSMQETKIPVKNAAVGLILNVILSVILSQYLGIGGLALATSISATLTTLMLFVSLRKKIGPFGMKQISISCLKILCASLLMGFIAKIGFNYLTTSIGQNLSLLVAIPIGALSYFAIIYFMKIEDVDVIVGTIKRRFGMLLKR